MLSSLLGTYTYLDDSGVEQTTPALRVTEPPATWRASGLEVRIQEIPTLRQVPAYTTGAVVETHRVYLVSHDAASDTLAALRKILSRWPTAQASSVDASERLGILSQHVVTI
jgi:hypothetical protein